MFTDDNIRLTAQDPTRSFIVQAPAGSGKTSLLVKRYLNLLLRIEQPEEILAITFTRKATQEMRTRIITALQNSTDPLSQKIRHRDQTYNWQILQHPERLKIQTIDSLCYQLISQSHSELPFNRHARIVQGSELLLYYREASETLFHDLISTSELSFTPQLQTILHYLHNDWDKTQRLFIGMLQSREQWLPHLVGIDQDQTLKAQIETTLQTLRKENTEAVKQLLPAELYQELITLLRDIIQFNQEVQYSVNIPTDLPNNHTQLTTEQLQALGELLLTKEFTWRKTTAGILPPQNKLKKEFETRRKYLKCTLMQLIEYCSTLSELRTALVELLLTPEASYSTDGWQLILALLRTLPLLVAYLRIVFNKHQVVDYSEITLAALQTLGTPEAPSELALQLYQQLQHILIDEFQDTSIAHFNLIASLVALWQPNDQHTLFLVGDPLQSIYRFRAAEVGLFLRVQTEGIAKIKPTPLFLTTNFRTTATLIQQLNSIFSVILPQQVNISLGAAPFIPAIPSVNIPADNSSTNVHLQILTAATEQDEAKFVAQTVTTIINQYPQDSIAILVKARSHLNKLLPLLTVPYNTTELYSLNELPLIQDLLALTRALYNLADRAAWLSILRAPWCNLSLAELLKIAQPHHELIWQNISRLVTTEKNIISTRLVRFYQQMQPIIQQLHRIPLNESVTKAWLALAANNSSTQNIFASTFLQILAKNVTSFNLAHFKAQLADTPLGEDLTSPTQLKILTIHKAKGLEFDHVIVPFLNKNTRTNSKQLLLWREQPNLHTGSNLILAPLAATTSPEAKLYDYLKRSADQKDRYEIGRLLYVALTRAKKSVHLIGNLKHEKLTTTSGSLLEQLQPILRPEHLIPIH